MEGPTNSKLFSLQQLYYTTTTFVHHMLTTSIIYIAMKSLFSCSLWMMWHSMMNTTRIAIIININIITAIKYTIKYRSRFTKNDNDLYHNFMIYSSHSKIYYQVRLIWLNEYGEYNQKHMSEQLI